MKTFIKILRWILTFVIVFLAFMVGAKAFGKRQASITANENRLRQVKALKKKRAGLQVEADLLGEEDERLINKIKKVDERIDRNETKIGEVSDEDKAAAVGRYLRSY